MPVYAKDVAEWMLERIRTDEILYRETAYEVRERFGEEFTLLNADGSLGIALPVLLELRALAGTTIVWSAGDRNWRLHTGNRLPSGEGETHARWESVLVVLGVILLFAIYWLSTSATNQPWLYYPRELSGRSIAPAFDADTSLPP